MTPDEFKTLEVGDRVRNNQTGQVVTVKAADKQIDWDKFNEARDKNPDSKWEDFQFTWAVWFEETALNSRLGDDLRPLEKVQ